MRHGLRQAADARVIYLDMNAFFASVEQQYRPHLRGKPLAVVSHDTPSGTVLASSYEAKAYGISTGTKVRIARSLCPQLLRTETSPALYRAVHRQFMQILFELFGPEAQARSIDEAVLHMPSNWATSERCWQLAGEIKAEIRDRLGSCIRCSIGIAPNALLAKVATDLEKPDGLVEISVERIPTVLAGLSLTDLPGIAERTAANLAVRGFQTPLDLYHSSPEELRRHFGLWGWQWWWRLHGFEPDHGHAAPLQSMSHEHVLGHWITSYPDLCTATQRMVDRLIHRLRGNGMSCRRVSLSCRLVAAPSFQSELHLSAPTDSYPALRQAASTLLGQLDQPLQGAVRKITVSFTGLERKENGLQLDLFAERLPQEEISQAVEKIRNRFGFEAVLPASILTAGTSIGKEQIGFGRLKDQS